MQLVLFISTIGVLVHIPVSGHGSASTPDTPSRSASIATNGPMSRACPHAGYLVGVLTLGRMAKGFKVPDHNTFWPFHNHMALSAMRLAAGVKEWDHHDKVERGARDFCPNDWTLVKILERSFDYQAKFRTSSLHIPRNREPRNCPFACTDLRCQEACGKPRSEEKRMNRLNSVARAVLAVTPLLLGVVLMALLGVVLMAPGARAATTLENMQAAFNGESNAHARYLAFAMQADKEGLGESRKLVSGSGPGRRDSRRETTGTMRIRAERVGPAASKE
jgi:hypothetical protein